MVRLPFSRVSSPGELMLGRIGRFRWSRPYRVPPYSRPKHTYLIGRTGQGKSKTLEWICHSDIAAGLGCCLIDPHSTLTEDLLKLLLSSRRLSAVELADKLIYVEPSRTDAIIPFNVLATPDEPYKVAAAVIEAFRRTWSQALQEAPQFSNIMIHAVLLLIQTGQTLVDLPRLLVDQDWRDGLLARAADLKLTAFFHDRYDRWGREAPLMRESSLNKVTALSINPYLEMMLGQSENRLDFRAIMDEGKILLLDLGRLDPETNRLIGSLVMTGFELAMRRRQRRDFYSLVIDEFAGYVANEGSAMTLAHVLSEGRKFGMGMTVAHQTLSQLTPRMLGALGNTETKIVFSVDRYDAEYLAKVIGRVDTEAVKRDPKTDIQHEVFAPLNEQWETIIDRLRHQQPRHATIAGYDGLATPIRTASIAPYTATDEQVEALRCASLEKWGIPYQQAEVNLKRREALQSSMIEVPAFDVLTT